MADTNPFNTPIDALPYVDTDLEQNPNLRNQLNSLIAAELVSILPKVATSQPQNLSHLPPLRPLPTPSTSRSSPSLFAHELSRIASKKLTPSGEGLDTTRYAMPPPPAGFDAPLEEWERAYLSSLAQLEHQRLRTLNGTLLSSLGSNAHRIQNFALETHLTKTEAVGEEVRNEVEQLNRLRKQSQVEAGGYLAKLEKRWTELVGGNMQLEIGCGVLEMEVYQLQQKHAELKARLDTMA